MNELPPWQWRCPHCLGGGMSLSSAQKHLRRKHLDCWSCRIERIMAQALQDGHGFIVADDPFPRKNHSQA